MFDFTILEAFLTLCIVLTLLVPMHLIVSSIRSEDNES